VSRAQRNIPGSALKCAARGRACPRARATRATRGWCAADPGPSETRRLCGPGPAVHRHSASKTRVNALKARASRCTASGTRGCRSVTP